jgi:hypothetical protein
VDPAYLFFGLYLALWIVIILGWLKLRAERRRNPPRRLHVTVSDDAGVELYRDWIVPATEDSKTILKILNRSGEPQSRATV